MSHTGICSFTALLVASSMATPAVAGTPATTAAAPAEAAADAPSSPAVEDYGSVFDQRFAQGEERYAAGEYERAALLWWGVTEVYPNMAYADRERFAVAAIGAWLAAYRNSGEFHHLESADRAWKSHVTVTGTLGAPSAAMGQQRVQIDALLGAAAQASPVVPDAPAVSVEAGAEPPASSAEAKGEGGTAPMPAVVSSEAQVTETPSVSGGSDASAIHGGDRRRTRGAVLTLFGGTSMLIGSVLLARAPARLREVEQNIQFAHFAEPPGWKLTRDEVRELDDAERNQAGLRGVGWTAVGAGLGVFVWGVIELSVLKRKSADSASLAVMRRRQMRLQPGFAHTSDGHRAMSMSWSGRF